MLQLVLTYCDYTHHVPDDEGFFSRFSFYLASFKEGDDLLQRTHTSASVPTYISTHSNHQNDSSSSSNSSLLLNDRIRMPSMGIVDSRR